MKTITLSLVSMALLIGCGSSSSDKTIETKTLDFNNTNAKYDLNDSLQSNSLATYKNTLYTDPTGQKVYLEVNKKESFPVQRSERESNMITLKNDADKKVIGTIKVLNDRIERSFIIGDKSKTIDVVRNFNIGDYITNSNMTEKISNATLKLNRTCKTTDAVTSKIFNDVSYNEILEIKCTTESELLSDNSLTPNASIDKTELIYMAKEKGIIYNESETCSSVTNITLGQETKVQVCTKEIKEIISFSEL